jgi:hypothetical protein
LGQGGDQLRVIFTGERFAGFQRLDQLADPIDNARTPLTRAASGVRLPARTSASASQRRG